MENYIDRCSMELTENLEEAIRKGERIDTKKYFGAYTLDVISSTAFGIQMNSQKDLNDPFVKDVASVMEEATSSSGLLTILAASVQSLVPLLRLLAIHLFPLTRWNSLLGNINRIIEERKQKRTNARTDFLQMILNYEETEGSKKEQIKSLSRTEVIAQVFVFFADGYDTTSIAIQFLAYNLACCPEVQEKVVQEIKSQIGDDKPTYESLAKLSYLDSVLQETLRMFPPVNIVNRMASEEVTIKGVTIPKGAGVVVPIANVMRDPEYFPDPDEFKPDRFIEGADGFVNPFSNLVFGFGPRQCIGMRLALLQIKMVMVHVLRKVRFIKTDDLKETPARKPGSFLSIVEKPLFITAVLREAATKTRLAYAHTDFLQMIVSYEDPEGFAKGQMKSLSRTEVIAQAMLFFVAGYDTTSTALQFLAYNLACCPEAQEKVVQEIQNLIGDGKPTYEGVAKLKYLDSVVQETLRMFPPLNTVNRMASEEVTIKGVTIPKGAGVCVPIANVMRDPEYFPDPDVFKPDRFIEGADGFVNPFSNLVFGFGPRQCIGMRLALLQIKMAMVHVFRKVRFIKTDDLKETPARKPGSFLSIVEKPLFISAVLRETAT
ncbi:hypothetical protein C0Q70_01008 [Pomacea canaliculata]|uniref:Cytochrome P450 n=1 Tax=Pomacea canaliculata TaxID=400727 RepID=A0A2T7PY98_POMCA|nr:hypothetical protein C0Q70_01008 [Pomacea canaliculata]